MGILKNFRRNNHRHLSKCYWNQESSINNHFSCVYLQGITENDNLKHKLSEELEAGGVSINTAAPMHHDIPYGGVKESGIGYEGGREAIYSYMHKKNINILS